MLWLASRQSCLEIRQQLQKGGQKGPEPLRAPRKVEGNSCSGPEFLMQMENAKGLDDARPLQSLHEVYEVRSLAIRAEELMH